MCSPRIVGKRVLSIRAGIFKISMLPHEKPTEHFELCNVLHMPLVLVTKPIKYYWFSYFKLIAFHYLCNSHVSWLHRTNVITLTKWNSGATGAIRCTSKFLFDYFEKDDKDASLLRAQGVHVAIELLYREDRYMWYCGDGIKWQNLIAQK